MIDVCSKQFISIDSFQQIFNALTFITEFDFKSEYLFRMCPVVTNLVTSLAFQAIPGAIMLFHFGRTRNGYVATGFIFLSSTAESSVTSDYVVIPERLPKSTNHLVEMRNRVEKSLVLFSTVDLINAVCKYM